MNNKAFTLAEMSISLLIISVVVGSGLAISDRMRSTEKAELTQNNLDLIEKALLQYRTANNRLPCPANGTYAPNNTNFGVEAANAGTCTGGTPAANFSAAAHATKTGNPATNVVGGVVPVATLGLPFSAAYDGYDNKISYHVDAKATETAAFSKYDMSHGKCFDIIIDDEKTWATDGDKSYLSFHAAYALISHGKNGHGAYTKGGARMNAGATNSYEQNNGDYSSAGAATTYNNLFFSIGATESPTDSKNVFDDTVRFKTREQLTTEQDTPSHSFPDLIVTTSGATTAENVNFYFRCGDKFVREQLEMAAPETDSANILDIAPNNAAILVGMTSKDHFRVWQYDGNKTIALPSSSFTPFPTGSTYGIDGAKWLPDGSFLVGGMDDAASMAAGQEISHYMKTAYNTYVRTATQPFSTYDGLPTFAGAGKMKRMGVSPDGQEVILTQNDSAPRLDILQADGTFTRASNPWDPALPVPIGASTNYISGEDPNWSDDGVYLTIGNYSSTNVTDRVFLFRNDGNHHYTRLPAPINPSPASPVNKAVLSPNGKFLVMLHKGATTWRIYQRGLADQFSGSPITQPANLPAEGKTATFSGDGKYLAVGTDAVSPTSLLIYKISGSTFTLLTAPNGPDTSPNKAVKDLDWKKLMDWEQ